jgi:hypothetical protein
MTNYFRKLLAALFGAAVIYRGPRFTTDVAFAFRMGNGFPGDVTRTHPVEIEPTAQSNTPVTAYGVPVVIAADGTNGVRGIGGGDGALTTIYGVSVRSFPQQAASAAGNFGAQAFGAATPPPNMPLPVMREGYIAVLVPTDAVLAVKGGPVFVWIAASAGTHTQGGFETAANGGNTIALSPSRYMFNGPQDASGNIELVVTS